MAAVRMLVKVSGSRDGIDWPLPGELLVCPDAEAQSLVGAGLAVIAAREAVAEPETASFDAQAAESAAFKRGPGRPRKS